MKGGERMVCPAKRARNLQQAAGVGADVAIGFECEHMGGLPVAERSGRLRLNEVVDPGASAAELLLGGLEELEPGNRAQKTARLLAYALGVAEMA